MRVKPLGMTGGIFRVGPGVQQRDAAVPRQRCEVIVTDLSNHPGQQVFGDISGHIHRVLGGREGGRIGKLQLPERRSRKACLHGGGQHVDALIHPVAPHNLRAQNPGVSACEQQLDGHDLAARIIAGVRERREHHPVIIQPGRPCLTLADAGGGHGQVEHLEHRRPAGPPIAALPAADVVGGNPRLPVGRTGQRYQRRRACNRVCDLHRIPDRIDVGVGGLHPVVDSDAVFDPQCKPGLCRQAALGPHAQGQQHRVGGQGRPRLGADGQPSAVCRLDAGQSLPQRQRNSLLPQMGMNKAGHIGVQLTEQLGLLFENRDRQTAPVQVFGHLYTDKTAPHNHGRPESLLLQRMADAQGVLHRAQREHAGQIDSGQGRTDRLSSGGKQQPVIGFGIGLPGLKIPHGNGMRRAVDRERLMPDAHIDVEAPAEAHGGLQRQLSRVGNHAAHIIRQPAVCVGDIARALEHYNFGPLVQPPDACGSRRSAGHPTDDDNLHPCSTSP